MKVQRSIEIAAPAVKIWSFLIEPDKISKWYTTMQQFKYTSQQRSGIGTPFYFEEKAAGRVMKINFIVTEWVENRILAFRMTSGDFLKGYEQRWTIETIPSGSRFTYLENIKLPYGVIGKFLGLFARFNSQATLKQMLTVLKSLIEG
jgi:uncharacterized protein YndB with AHSA1/START domain